MDSWLQKITDWFLSLAKAIFTALIDFVHDAVIWVFEQLLNAISALVTALPVPDFLQNVNLGSLFNGLPSYALFVTSQCHIPEALAIIGSGVLFRLLRKLFTLGQW